MPVYHSHLRLNRKPMPLEFVHTCSHAEIARTHAWRKFLPTISAAKIMFGEDVEVVLISTNVTGEPIKGPSGTIVIDEWTDEPPK